MTKRVIVLLALAITLSWPWQSVSSQDTTVSVVTSRYSLNRSGANLNETILNLSNVNPNQFGKLFSREVEGDVYAQPLYIPNVDIPGSGTHNVVYVATMHNMVYAFDADDPALADPLWEVNLGEPFTQNVYADIIGGEVGVLSTPVIDPATQTIYLVSRIWENEAALYRLQALDIRTGEPKFGSPADIHLSYPGTGVGSVNGLLSLDSSNQLQRPGLLLLNGNIYIGFGSNNDVGIWYGWLAAYNASDIQQMTGLFNTAPNGQSAGIWMSGTGIASDGSLLYLATGNGTYSAASGGTDYSESILKLEHSGDDLVVRDYFTPFNWQELDAVDSGLGSTGVVLIPDTSLLVSGGKDGNLYVISRDDMGQLASEDSQNAHIFSAGTGRMYVTPVYWDNGPGGLPTLYTWNEIDVIKSWSLDIEAQRFNPEPSSASYTQARGMPVGSISLSANGTDPSTGILWALYAPSSDTGDRTGVLVALDATDLSRALWHSELQPERDSVGLLAKFTPATVANGKVYVASFSNRLNVYGLLDG